MQKYCYIAVLSSRSHGTCNRVSWTLSTLTTVVSCLFAYIYFAYARHSQTEKNGLSAAPVPCPSNIMHPVLLSRDVGQHGTTFLQLPAEVRNHIYEWLFAGAVIEDHGFSPNPIRLQNYHLPITMTCHQIRQESVVALKAATTLHFRLGVAGAPPVPARVLVGIRTIRMPAHRLQTLDLGSFVHLRTLILDVSIEPGLWKVLQQAQSKNKVALNDVSDMIHISMTMGIFERSWDLEKLWRDQSRTFKIICFISSWVREIVASEPVLIDLDRGLILDAA